MRTTLLIDHPWRGSFNYAVLAELKQALEQRGAEYQLIDLQQDGFNPVMTEQELAVYEEGIVMDPLVAKYIDILKNTEQLILIFPIWWYSTPASLKGFFDKVLLNGSAFYDDGDGIQPMYNIQHTHMFTTCEQPKQGLVKRCHNSLFHQIETTLADVGIHNLKWHNLEMISSLSNEERNNFIISAPDKIS